MNNNKILLIDLTSHPLHRMEFVKPIEDILERKSLGFDTINFMDISFMNISINPLITDKYSKIIISGTSLKDFWYLKYKKYFDFLKTANKPILGICGGMQLICIVYGCKLIKGQEIGLKDVVFKDFLGISGRRTIYCLHNMAVKEDALFKSEFIIYAKTHKNAKSSFIQAIKHKNKPIYGMLFHPEARNKEFIERFLYLNQE